MKQPREIRIDWKEVLAEALRQLSIIGRKFSGKIEIDVNEGGIRNAKRTERLD